MTSKYILIQKQSSENSAFSHSLIYCLLLCLQAPTIPVRRWLQSPVWMRTSVWGTGVRCWVLHLNTFPPLAPPSAGRQPSTRHGRPSWWAPPEPKSPLRAPRSANASTTPNPRNRPALPPRAHPEPFSASLLKTPSAGRASVSWNGSILYWTLTCLL